jgi:SAM-dependent methyltransferase
LEKLKYFLWSGVRYPFADTSCPACEHTNTTALTRKALVTRLYECRRCQLRFRVPKESSQSSEAFYQHSYHQGPTTDCPTLSELEHLTSTGFRNSDKDFAVYIQVLRALGMKSGDVILDYGSSWGYGSWQLRQAGCRVYSFEISAPRAQYAREHLGCKVLESPNSCPEKVDFVFSAHVIEHLPNPNSLWQVARELVKPTGTFVMFMPNGEPTIEEYPGYQEKWGQVHPLLLCEKALASMATAHGFSGIAYSSPYDFDAIENQKAGVLYGDELLYVAKPLILEQMSASDERQKEYADARSY